MLKKQKCLAPNKAGFSQARLVLIFPPLCYSVPRERHEGNVTCSGSDSLPNTAEALAGGLLYGSGRCSKMHVRQVDGEVGTPSPVAPLTLDSAVIWRDLLVSNSLWRSECEGPLGTPPPTSSLYRSEKPRPRDGKGQSSGFQSTSEVMRDCSQKSWD